MIHFFISYYGVILRFLIELPVAGIPKNRLTHDLPCLKGVNAGVAGLFTLFSDNSSYIILFRADYFGSAGGDCGFFAGADFIAVRRDYVLFGSLVRRPYYCSASDVAGD